MSTTTKMNFITTAAALLGVMAALGPAEAVKCAADGQRYYGNNSVRQFNGNRGRSSATGATATEPSASAFPKFASTQAKATVARIPIGSGRLPAARTGVRATTIAATAKA